MAVSQSASLYVGDLDPTVGESELMLCFSSIGAIASIRVCRDTVSGASLCYAYVNFQSPSDASRALESLNHTNLNGKPMRIMWSHRDPHPRKTGVANLFIKNLEPSVNNAKLHEIFGKFGTILSSKVAEENGRSKGFGFVQFDSEEAALSAVEALHGSTIDDKKVYVSKFVKKIERQSACEEHSFTNVYVNNLDHELTEDVLKEKFSAFGTIKSAIIMKDDHGKPRGFGFICFESSEDAKKAVEAMNGAQIGSKNVYVGRAQKKDERKQLLRQQFEERHSQSMAKFQGLNVYVKNLDDSVDDYKLQQYFSIFGKIISARVMRDDKGFSRGFGFVCFSTCDDAKKAVDTLHGTMFHDRPLYVAIAQRKVDRQTEMQLKFTQNVVQPSYNSTCEVSSYHSPHYYSPLMSAVSQSNPYQPIMYQHFGGDLSVPLRQQGYETMLPQKVSSKQRQQKQTRDWVNELQFMYPQHAPLFSCVQHHAPLLTNEWQGIAAQQPVKYNSGNQYQEMNWRESEQQKLRCLKNVMNKPSSSEGPSHQGTKALRKKLTGTTPGDQKKMIGGLSFSSPGETAGWGSWEDNVVAVGEKLL